MRTKPVELRDQTADFVLDFRKIDLRRAPGAGREYYPAFRHLLERHELGGAMLNAVNQYLAAASASPRGRGRDHYSRALINQEPERRTRSRDASDAQGEAVVLRVEGTHRRGLEARPCAFGVHVGGFGGRQAHAAGSVARGRRAPRCGATADIRDREKPSGRRLRERKI